MMNKLFRRLASAACAAAIMFSSVGNNILPHAVAESGTTAVYSELSDYRQQNFEIHPNSNNSDQLITLDGLMPEGAKAEAVDVTDEYDGIAAYDITITAGDEEYQPDAEHPVLVEISDPAIPDSSDIELWHIKDNSEREQISYFSVGNGRISFSATGFSVYEIIAGTSTFTPVKESVLSIDELTGSRAKKGFVLYYGNDQFFTNTVNGNSALALTSNLSNAAVWYIEPADDNYRIYTYVGDTKKYLHQKSGNNIELSNSADTYDISPTPANDSFYIKRSSEERWLQYSKSGKGIRYYTDNNNGTNSSIKMYYADKAVAPKDVYDLDGKTYGLMNYISGTHGYALMAGSEVHTLIQLVTHQKSENELGTTLYVDEGSEVTRWTFHSGANGTYTLSCATNNGTEYLAVSDGILVMTDNAENAARFTASPDNKGRLQLSYDGQYITFTAVENEEGTTTSFTLSPTVSENSWLSLIDFAELTDDDLITYSADRISVSKAEDGQRVIVYTRIWNEDTKHYDIYAIDHNGTLYPCYASGGKILWLGDGTCSLEWVFMEHIDEVTKEPNYYYELYNPYSEKYIAPQLSGDQILSEDTIGINMPGRRNGEFYSDIIAWDKPHYAYIGMKPNEDNTRLVPCAQSLSVPFYFATLEELNLSDRLHPVKTVDNAVHGITMKMKNFYGTSGGNGATEQNAYIVDTTFRSEAATKGLLSSSLDTNGYPTATKSKKYLGDLFSGAQTVNNLFIDSVYNSSGYFEYDSTQNFATLKATNDNNFTVYRELGTSDGESKSTLRHGQFFPYNNISPQNYSTSNPINLYNADARTTNENLGQLSEDDPRKYEKLYSAGNKNTTSANPIDYYFGMEMGASFVQTVSGLDAWGHDIIFEFKGDDDFWLYVDDELVIDLGGIHSALSGKVNFRTGEVNVNGESTTLIDIFRANFTARGVEDVETKLSQIFEDNGHGQYIFKDYTTHTMRVFYMERGAGASNLHMRFNLASVTPGHVVVAKSISGEGADVLDTDFLEYPFQIYYTEKDGEDGEEGEEKLLSNTSDNIRVTYQNSNQPVTFVKKYRPPGFTEAQAYENIYFLNPTKNAEILFPDDTIRYRIVECAVDSSVYSNVMINGEPVPSSRIEIKGELKSYSSDPITAEERPTITFDNHVRDNVIKDLYITKKLLDENDNEITDDPETFNFRLHISSVDVDPDKMPLANMYKYYILSPNKKLCRFDPVNACFAETELEYSRDIVKAVNDGLIEGITTDNITFYTSGFGSISGIPSGYTICVPGLPVGSLFKVTEDVKSGYGLMGYECVLGEKVKEDNSTEDIPSYFPYDDVHDNVGRVRAEENPQMEVHNKKGYGLTVKKNWSDLHITTSHAPVYTAVYVDGELLEGSVKQITSPAITAYYFWTSLKPYADGSPRTSFDGYTVREVTVSGSPVIADDGTVTNYTSVTPVESGGGITLNATRTPEATPDGETPAKNFNYVASYEQGEENGSSRTDTITNNREGGIAVRLFRWNSRVPLAGGRFTLLDSSGKTVGEYTSNTDGTVAMLYNFEPEELYTLVQTSAPKGYVGIQKKICFKANLDDTVDLYYEDGTTVWGKTNAADKNWANWKSGENGITAFIDVFNKQFNFKIIKTDSEDPDIKLGSAHFALYKQANTTISGYVKNKEPMTGFEDLKTINGEVDICGGNSGRVINPGLTGSVYFLTETTAPPTYSKLNDDIIFRISPLGVPTLISDSYNGQLIETEESFIYTLSVPNVKSEDAVTLTIKKRVSGQFGDKTKDFTFTLTVDGTDENAEYEWLKNDDPQSIPLRSGDTFTMKNNDVVLIVLPPEADITVSEDNEGYKTTFALGKNSPEAVNEKTFRLTESEILVVTNDLSGTIPTGIPDSLKLAIMLTLLPAFPAGYILYRKKRRTE